MRLRIVAVALAIMTALAATVFLWRQVFPFRDHLAEFLPEGTIAYVHVNLTSSVRRALLANLDRSSFGLVTKKSGRAFGSPTTLRTVLQAREVHELGIVWYQPEGQTPLVVLMVGQRASSHPDVIPATTVQVGGGAVQMIVVRVGTGESAATTAVPIFSDSIFLAGRTQRLARLPVQAFLHPRRLPVAALEASAYRMPEIMTAAGTVDRHGFTMRSDGVRPLFDRRRVVPLLASPRAGSMQILNIPIRAIAAEISAPTHRELFAALTGVIPDVADVIVDPAGVAVHLAQTDLQHERTRAALQAIAARVWPVVEQRMLDGEPAEVAVADPSSVRVVPTSSDRWIIERAGEPVAAGAARGDGMVIATSASLLEAIMSPTRAMLRIPERCIQRSPSDNGIIAVLPIHPQLVAVFGMSSDGSRYAVCGGDWGN